MSSSRVARLFKGSVGAIAILASSALTAGCLGGATNTAGTDTATTASARTTTANAGSTTATATTSSAAQSSARTSTSGPPTGSAVVLPFTGLDHPTGLAVDKDGAVYVADTGNNRIVKLAGNSYTQNVLPFTGLDHPNALSVDKGNVSVTDASTNHVLWYTAQLTTPQLPWQATSTTEWVGPFTGLQAPHGVLMLYGGVYDVVDSGDNRVMQWNPKANAPEVLPFSRLNNPNAIAMYFRDVYVVDSGNNRALELASSTETPTQTDLGYTGLKNPTAIALDGSTNINNPVIYVVDSGNNRVVELKRDPAAQMSTQTIVPFTGLNDPEGAAVDAFGNLYVVDSGNNRVLKLEKAFLGS